MCHTLCPSTSTGRIQAPPPTQTFPHVHNHVLHPLWQQHAWHGHLTVHKPLRSYRRWGGCVYPTRLDRPLDRSGSLRWRHMEQRHVSNLWPHIPATAMNVGTAPRRAASFVSTTRAARFRQRCPSLAALALPHHFAPRTRVDAPAYSCTCAYARVKRTINALTHKGY